MTCKRLRYFAVVLAVSIIASSSVPTFASGSISTGMPEYYRFSSVRMLSFAPAQSAYVSTTIKSVGMDGNAINGLWTVVKIGDTTVAKGFTPLTFQAKSGSQYTVSMANYQNYVFDHWQDGTQSSIRTVAPTQQSTYIGVYNTGQPAVQKVTLSVSSVSQSGSNIDGLWTVLDSDGNTISTGFTPFTSELDTGKAYTVTVADYQNYVFDHWQDGSKSRSVEIRPSQDISLKAYYNTSATVQPPVQTDVTLSVSTVSTSGSTINGLWTVIDSNGQETTGFSPVTYTATSGNRYAVTVADYGQYTFDHWEGGSTSRTVEVTPTQNMALKAYYNVGTVTQPPSQPPSTSGNSGVIVPLYTYPGSTWDRVIAAKQAHPDVPIAVILNPANGPGGYADPTYVSYISKMKAAGIETLGYVCTRYAGISSYAYNCPNWTPEQVNADSLKWKNWYNVDGIFFDEMANWAGSEWFYTNIDDYAKSIGLSYTVGNPGTDTSSSYVGTVDNIIIYESGGYPSASQIGGWHSSYSKSNWGVLPMASWLDVNAVKSYIPYAQWIGVSPSWNTLPSFFEDLVAALD